MTPWTIQSMEFSRPEYWNEQPFPSPGDLPNPGIEPKSPTLQGDSLPAEPQGKPSWSIITHQFCHLFPRGPHSTQAHTRVQAHIHTHTLASRPLPQLSETHPLDAEPPWYKRTPPTPRVIPPACFLHLKTSSLGPPTSSQTLGKPELRREGPPATYIPRHCPSPSINPCLLPHPGQAAAKLGLLLPQPRGGGRLGHRAKTPNQALKASDLRCHL